MSSTAGRRGDPAPAALAEGAREVVRLEHAAVRRGGRTVWSDVSVSVGTGEFMAVLGPNGAGKSTLLQVVLGLLPVSAGSATVLEMRPGRANPQIGYLPQRHSFEAGTRIRGVDIVRLGLDGGRWGVPLPGRLAGAGARLRGERVQEVIELVGAAGYAERPIGDLSGGEQQRLLIAQALVRRPRIMMLDEPLDSLDLANQRSVAALVQSLCRREGVTVLLVAHDINPILGYLDRVVYFAGGAAVAGTPGEVITAPILSALYGVPVEVLRTSDGRLVVVGTPEPPHVHGGRHGH